MEKVLDDDFHSLNFLKPVCCRMYEAQWLLFCNRLQRRSIFWFIGIIAINIYIFHRFSPLFLLIIILICAFSIRKMYKKFKRLRQMTKHYFIVDQDRIEYHSNSFLRTYYFKDLKSSDELEWGIELEFRNKRKEHAKLTIPRMLENYDNLASFFKQIK